MSLRRDEARRKREWLEAYAGGKLAAAEVTEKDLNVAADVVTGADAAESGVLAFVAQRQTVQ